LKNIKIEDDFSVCFKLESYPNRDSTVFQKKFDMDDCETFIRGTLRFVGFSYVIAAFHDVGLTAETPIPEGITNLRELTESVIRGSSAIQAPLHSDQAIKNVMVGASAEQVDFAKRFLSKISLSYVPDHEQVKAIEILL
jgi:hypothetical protein